MRTPCPARVVAVSQMLLDVLDDLADQEMDQMTRAEGDLARILIAHRQDLRDILTQARAEMSALAPALLAEPYPALG